MNALSQQTLVHKWFRAGILAGISIFIFVNGALGETVASTSPATSVRSLCNKALIADVRRALGAKFNEWTIQSPQKLSPFAQKRWKSEKPMVCPGVAKGHFDSAGKYSLAVLIVHEGKSDSSAKMLLFEETGGVLSSDYRILQEMESGANNFFIHAVPVPRFFDKESTDRFQVRAPEAILLVDAGKDVYEANIFFWTGDAYRHEPVDY